MPSDMTIPGNLERQRSYVRKHYNDNKQYYLDKAKARKQALREYINSAKSRPCTDCKIQYPFYVMQFDHIGDDKEYDIGTMATRGASIARIDAEIAKCEVVCANCHAARTYVRLRSPKDTTLAYGARGGGSIPPGGTRH